MKTHKSTIHLLNFATSNPEYKPKHEWTDIASTLLARDYKGPANFVKMNGVIEWSDS